MNREHDKDYRRALFRCWLIGAKELRGNDLLAKAPWHVLNIENHFVENLALPLSYLYRQPDLGEYAFKHVDEYLHLQKLKNELIYPLKLS